ncbi:MAG TPA: hypothetical protein PK281_07215, partial [Flavobacteriales bacterium]|nr:hypothetical protein [Flavobacteriales bacterium]
VAITAQVGYDKMGDVMKWVKDSRYEYDNPVMENQFSITIHVQARRVDEVKNLFVDNKWMDAD